MAAASPNNILVIKLGALGDFIQALGPMRAIRQNHPAAVITLLTTKPFAAIAEASGYFNKIEIDYRPKFFQPGKWLSLRCQLNKGHYIRVYDLQNNDRTSFYFQLLSPKPEWVGIAKDASHRNTSQERTAGQAFYGHVQTLGLAGIKNIAIDKMEWMQGRNDFSGLQSPYILLVPGSAANRPEKRWPSGHYADLANKIAESGYLPVLIGTEAESAVLQDIAAACPRALNLCGQTDLFDIVTLARDASFAIGNDTGPMHMIAPTGIPALVIFSGNSNPVRHAPIGANVGTLQTKDLKDLTFDTVWENMMAQQGVVP